MKRVLASLGTAYLLTGATAWAEPQGALTGFVEVRAGARLQEDEFEKAASLGELRLHLEREWDAWPAAVVRAAGDLVYDPVEADHAVDLETGRGAIDLREANAVFRPFPFADVKVGRQILTWGTGDLLFINDLFPKDYRAFFIGRDDAYLKAPSDAVRVSLFSQAANLDLVYTPRFDADRFVDGSRLSFFDPAVGRTVGRNADVDPVNPDAWFEDDEVSARVYRHFGAVETAAYVHHGFWKSPLGVLPAGRPFFSRLAVYGASVRGPFARGIASAEFGFYDSLDDPTGSNPLVANSQFRFLAGLEREALPELTIGAQFYLERQGDFDARLEALPSGAASPRRTRHLLTLRLTKLALRQTLTVGAFGFWSPSDDDGYGRLRASYRLTDAWLVEAGANVFAGGRDRPFGQLRDNTNVFGGLRRSF